MATIGVLALQGNFREHINVLKRLNVESVEVRLATDIDGIDALIIPGGESTTITKLMKLYGIDRKIVEKHNKGMPIFGTCAGAIVLAKEVESNTVEPLGLADITVARNAYGRQIDSFEADLNIEEIGKFHGIFIRAPKIKVGKRVKVLAELNGEIVLCQQDKILISTFHPELTDDTRVHEYFLKMCNRG